MPLKSDCAYCRILHLLAIGKHNVAKCENVGLNYNDGVKDDRV